MKVTIGELLGIDKQGTSIGWDGLADNFSKIGSISFLKNSPVSQMASIFGVVLKAFSMTQKISSMYQKARWAIQLATKIITAMMNYAMIAEIINDFILILQSLLIKLAISGVNAIEQSILSIQIDLGDLTVKQLKTLRELISTLLDGSFAAINSCVEGYNPTVNGASLPLFTITIDDLTTYLNTQEASIIDTSSIDTIVPDLTTFYDTLVNSSYNYGFDDDNTYGYDENNSYGYTESNDNIINNLNAVIYADNSKTLIGITPSYPKIGGTSGNFDDVLGTKQISLDELQGTVIINNGDTSWMDRVAEDTNVSRELMDGISKVINDNITLLLNQVLQTLKGMKLDTSDIEKDIYANNSNPQYDLNVLNNLASGFTDYIVNSQFTFTKDTLLSIFKLNDYMLKKLINTLVAELSKAYQNRNKLLLSMLTDYINALPNSGIVDPDILKQMIKDYLAALQENLKIDLQEIFNKVLYEYLKYVFSFSGVTDENRNAFLIQKVISKFFNYKRNFINDIVEKIKKIRLQNDSIDEDYYTYSYNSLKANLIDIINNYTTIDELKTSINTAIYSFNLSYQEATHALNESASDKINILKNTLYTTIITIIQNEKMPEIVWTDDELSDVTDKEKEILNSMLETLFSDYRKKLIMAISNSLFTTTYPSIQIITEDKAEELLLSYILEKNNIIKSDLLDGLFNVITYCQENVGLNLKDYLLNYLNNFQFNLEFSFKFASLLKENEIDYINKIADILISI